MEVFTTTKEGKLSKEDINMMIALQENAHRLNAYSVNIHRNNENFESDDEIKPMSKTAKNFFKAAFYCFLIFVFARIDGIGVFEASLDAIPQVYQGVLNVLIKGLLFFYLAGVLWAGFLGFAGLNKILD